jgi:hypothetical protein
MIIIKNVSPENTVSMVLHSIALLQGIQTLDYMTKDIQKCLQAGLTASWIKVARGEMTHDEFLSMIYVLLSTAFCSEDLVNETDIHTLNTKLQVTAIFLPQHIVDRARNALSVVDETPEKTKQEAVELFEEIMWPAISVHLPTDDEVAH